MFCISLAYRLRGGLQDDGDRITKKLVHTFGIYGGEVGYTSHSLHKSYIEVSQTLIRQLGEAEYINHRYVQ